MLSLKKHKDALLGTTFIIVGVVFAITGLLALKNGEVISGIINMFIALAFGIIGATCILSNKTIKKRV